MNTNKINESEKKMEKMNKQQQQKIKTQLENIAIQLTGKFHPVDLALNQQSQTDGETIYLDYNKALIKNKALVCHEAGHIGYGSFEINIDDLGPTKDKKLIHEISNVTEDVRVDNINSHEWKGFVRRTRESRKKSMKKFKKKTKKNKNILYWIYLFLQETVDYFPEWTKLTEKYIQEIKEIKKFLKKYLSLKASMVAIIKIYNILSEILTEKEKKRQSGPSHTQLKSKSKSKSKDNSESQKSESETTSFKNKIKKKKDVKIKKGEIKDGEIKQSLKKAEKELKDQINKNKKQAKQTMKQRKKDSKNNQNVINIDSIESIKQVEVTDVSLYNPDNDTKSCREIIKSNNKLIKKTQNILKRIKNQPEHTLGETGELTRHMTRYITSNRRNTRVFNRKIHHSKTRISLMIDLSGSMTRSKRFERAKTAAIIFAKALEGVAETRIVGFCGSGPVGRNIVYKRFKSKLNCSKLNKIEKINDFAGNPDGAALLYESKYNLNPNDIIIIISDGTPCCGTRYGFEQSLKDFKKVQNYTFAFSLDATGSHLKELYGENNYVITTNSIGNKIKNKIVIAAKKILLNQN